MAVYGERRGVERGGEERRGEEERGAEGKWVILKPALLCEVSVIDIPIVLLDVIGFSPSSSVGTDIPIDPIDPKIYLVQGEPSITGLCRILLREKLPAFFFLENL